MTEDLEPQLRARIAQLERELRSSEERLGTLVESLPFDFWMMDAAGCYTQQNASARSNWGSALGKRPEDVAPSAEVLALWSANNRRVLSGETIREEVSFARGGERRHLLNVLAPLWQDGVVRGVVGVNLDVTDTRRSELQAQRSQRLESLGVLAGGIAHDFNNLLAGILGNIALARRTLVPGSEAEGYLADAEGAYVDARALTRQLLTFAQGGAPVLAVVDVGPLVRDAAPFAATGSACKVHVTVDAGLPAANVDAGQLRQAIHNLVLNAVQAMPEGGVVQVSVAAARAPEADCAAALAGASCVRIRVADVGVGIPPEAMARLFEPYFTTKSTGHGLGLAMVHSIVHRHGGCVRVASTGDLGTTFDVFLPAVSAAAPAVAAQPPPEGIRAQRILVVEDEEILRRLTANVLRDEGHEVETAATAAAAIELFAAERATGRPFTVVLLDLTLPGGRGGVACLDELRALDPAVRAVFASGYSDDPVLAAPERYGARAALAKPFLRAELVLALGRALEK